jgi:hypothetical protein
VLVDFGSISEMKRADMYLELSDMCCGQDRRRIETTMNEVGRKAAAGPKHMAQISSFLSKLMAGGWCWCWFVLREECCWLVADD